MSWLQENGVHEDFGDKSCGLGLDCLGDGDFEVVMCDERIVAHVLRLEWADLEA